MSVALHSPVSAGVVADALAAPSPFGVPVEMLDTFAAVGVD